MASSSSSANRKLAKVLKHHFRIISCRLEYADLKDIGALANVKASLTKQFATVLNITEAELTEPYMPSTKAKAEALAAFEDKTKAKKRTDLIWLTGEAVLDAARALALEGKQVEADKFWARGKELQDIANAMDEDEGH